MSAQDVAGPEARWEVAIAAVQLESQDDLEENLARASELAAVAARRGASIILLPENFAFMGSEDQKREIAENVSAVGDGSDGPILRWLRELSRSTKAHVIAGGMPERSAHPARPFNTSVVVAPSGEVVATYRKIHLFDVQVGDGQTYLESASTAGGDEPVVTHACGVGIGLSVCYDLRFPELYRALVDRGAELLTVPAAFTLATGKDHWTVLLRARAIESQCWLLAAAQVGLHPKGRRTYGKSCIIDPWGDVVAQASDGPGVVVATIDGARLERIRASLPSLKHRSRALR